MNQSKTKREKRCTCEYYEPNEPHEFTCALNVNQSKRHTATPNEKSLTYEVINLTQQKIALVEALKSAQIVCLDSIVGQAVKAGVLEESETHAGLCLVGFIMEKIGYKIESALKQAGE